MTNCQGGGKIIFCIWRYGTLCFPLPLLRWRLCGTRFVGRRYQSTSATSVEANTTASAIPPADPPQKSRLRRFITTTALILTTRLGILLVLPYFLDGSAPGLESGGRSGKVPRFDVWPDSRTEDGDSASGTEMREGGESAGSGSHFSSASL